MSTSPNRSIVFVSDFGYRNEWVGICHAVIDSVAPATQVIDLSHGVPPLDVNRKRVNVRFYQIAMLFILFDIEAAFLYPWAVIYRDVSRGNQGMFLFGEMLVFIGLLAVGYVYVWKKKTFDWK